MAIIDGEAQTPKGKLALAVIVKELDLLTNIECEDVLSALRDRFCFHCLGKRDKKPDNSYSRCYCMCDD